MKLVEKHVITKNHKDYDTLDHLTFLSKNLYNATLYEVRQHYFRYQKGEEVFSYLTYNMVNKQFTDEKQADYIALPRKVSKWTQQLVEADMKSFFGLIKKKKAKKYDKPVHLPRYADKRKGRKPLHYEKGALSFVTEGFVKLSQADVFIPTKLSKEEVRFVRITPKTGYFVISIGYEKKEKTPLKNERYVGIDLGVNNLATISSNVFSPMIVNGRPIKSINQYYNKEIARLKSRLPKGKYSSQRIETLYRRRKAKIEDYFHKSTRYLTNHFAKNQISLVVIGKNKDWKQDVKLGKKNNQNFVQIPFQRWIDILTYKCKLLGIRVEVEEEAYTSKCSFLDNEKIGKKKDYAGKRIRRGLYQSADGTVINADLNGSLNILKKYLKRKKNVAWNDQIWSDLVGACCSGPGIHKWNF